MNERQCRAAKGTLGYKWVQLSDCIHSHYLATFSIRLALLNSPTHVHMMPESFGKQQQQVYNISKSEQ